MKKTTRWSLVLLGLTVLCGWGFDRVGAESAKTDAKAKPKPTATLAASPQPASTRARIPVVDFYPTSVEFVRQDGSGYRVRVSLQCESSLPLKNAVEVQIQDAGALATPSLTSLPVAPCAARQTGEMYLRGDMGDCIVTVDPHNRVLERDESNNSCRFNRVTLEASGRINCR